MIPYVLTKNIKERHDIALIMEKVWGTETVHQTFSVCQILMPLLLREDFCQLLCHALSEYGGINYLALRVDEIHGRKPGNLVILGNLGFLPLLELAVLLPFHTVCLGVVVELLLVGIHGYADELGTGAVLLEHLL